MKIAESAATALERGREVTVRGNLYTQHHLFEPSPDSPVQAYLLHLRTPGGQIKPHFHDRDQFQVFVEGEGRFGKHGVRPLTVHYADRFSPYGPIVAGEAGIKFFTLRAHVDSGARYMPGSHGEMKQRAGRSVSAMVGEAVPGVQVLLEASPDGLAAWGIRLGPTEPLRPPPEPHGLGEFWLVASGSLRLDEQSLGRWSCVWLDSSEHRPSVQADAEGCLVMVMRLPQRAPSATPIHSNSESLSV
jgi:hypothetical protein